MHGLSKPTANVSLDALRAERSAINKRAQQLTAERSELALASVLGDAVAKARIDDIDAERSLCAARVETIEAAIHTLQKAEQQASWRKHLPNMERALHCELTEQYRNWSNQLNRLLLGRQPHDIRDLARALEQVERLEHDTARMIADRILPEARIPFHTAGDQADLNRAGKEHAKLIEQRNAHITEAAAELVATNNAKRPKALDEVLANARHRLRVG
jgi:hypothetical protein